MMKRRLIYFCTALSALLIVLLVAIRDISFSSYWQALKSHALNKSMPGYGEDNSSPNIPLDAASGLILLDGVPKETISQAFKQARDYSLIKIGKGYYNEAAVLRADNVKVFAEEGAVIYGKAARGKGAMLIQGDNTYIEGIECHSITVPDRNGVCVRFEGSGLVLNNVYFHHSEGGLLGSNKAGDIIIENSRFEHMGYGVFSHGIYTFEPTRLIIKNSRFLSNRNGGHEVKSRSSYTEIVNSIVAAPSSRDSRLVDIPNGGVVIMRGNVFVEGFYSENHSLFSWGVEGVKHKEQKFILEDNLIVSDKPYANLLDVHEKPEQMRVTGNIVVGNIEGVDPLLSQLKIITLPT